MPTVRLSLSVTLAVFSAWAAVHAKGQQAPSAGAAPPEARSAAPASPRAILDTYCVTCHNQRLKTADLALDTLDLAQVADHAGVWEKVVRKVRVGMMPPQGVPRP
ncbi:MAG TPA: c-type cytochrome domain-containing protein, partial [Gemmatimonadales bacterium]|nr:c-type cytochrome domain-containing protein [Gemmatimonadales bacterium]